MTLYIGKVLWSKGLLLILMFYSQNLECLRVLLIVLLIFVRKLGWLWRDCMRILVCSLSLSFSLSLSAPLSLRLITVIDFVTFFFSGSGILSHGSWAETANILNKYISKFPDIQILNLGGGLGIVENPSIQSPLDIDAMASCLQAFKDKMPNLELWLEPGCCSCLSFRFFFFISYIVQLAILDCRRGQSQPNYFFFEGRYLVGEGGVMLANVTQMKEKGSARFVGINAGKCC